MDVYKIGVSIALQNGMSAALAVIQKDVLGLHKAVDLTTKGLNRMKVAAIGFAGVTIGGAMLTGLAHLEKAGERYTHQLQLMRDSAGMTFDEIEKAQRQANATARNVLTTVPSENLKALRELRAVFPHYEDALRNLDTVQRASAVMGNLRDAGGNRNGLAHGTEQVYEMSKAAEMQGAAQDPARFAAMVDAMVKASQWSGGKITGSDFHSMLKYMRGAGVNLSDRFLMEMLPSIIQEFKTGKGGASGVGVGFAGLMRYIVGGHMSQRSIDAGLKYGLIDPTKVIRKKNGSIAGLRERGFYGSEMAQSDLDKWVDTYFLPKMQAHGVGLNDSKALTSAIGAVFEGRVSQQFLEQFVLPTLRARLNQDVPKITGSGGVAAYDSLSRYDPVMVRDQFYQQLERVAESLGKVAAPMATEALYQITRGIAWFADAIERHPTAAKWLLGFVAALGGLLIVMGTLAVAAAGLTALGGIGVATGITAVAGGLLALGTAAVWLMQGENWRRVPGMIRSAWAGFVALMERGAKNWGEAIVRGWGVVSAKIGEWISQIPDLAKKVGAALAEVSSAILSWAASLPGRVGRAALDAVGIKPAAPGTENAPNGVPPKGPTFGSPLTLGPPPPAPINLSVTTNTNIDGKQVASSVEHHLVKGMTGPSSGLTSFDPRAGVMGGMAAIP